ncbi:WecB/TagA/CpsF family glycosyltransferase, partial [Stenotrophomonas maltophilia]
MTAHAGRIGAVMLGVGAAFDFHAGTAKRAPRWMQDSGLEWLHRLASEPTRLWQRYLVSNSAFVLHTAGDLTDPAVRRARRTLIRAEQRELLAQPVALQRPLVPRDDDSRFGTTLEGWSRNLEQQHMTEL